MKRTLLVGDSGGTGTDWCLVTPDGRRTCFSGESYHPSRFSPSFFDSMRSYWQDKQLPADTIVRFYGAGCTLPQNREIVEAHFHSLGFSDVEVGSDLMGACRGLLGDLPGWLAILGTGSVLASYDGRDVAGIRGGFGYLLGDEGSGFAFGRLLISRYLNGALSPELSAGLRKRLGDRSQVLQQAYGPEGKQWIGRLAAETATCPETEALHRENIEAFARLYLPSLNMRGSISFCGSYAYFQADLLREVLAGHGWDTGRIVRNPIGVITDHTIKATL